MFTIKRTYEFSAAHRVEGHPKCGRLHGHNYVVTVEVAGPLDDNEMVIDFADLDKIVKPIVEEVDHRYMVSGANIDADDPYFKHGKAADCVIMEGLWQTTAECLAAWFAERIDGDPNLPDSINCYSITVQETGKNYATWHAKPA